MVIQNVPSFLRDSIQTGIIWGNICSDVDPVSSEQLVLVGQ